MTPNQLPPLPEPDTHCFDDDTGKDAWSYSADQMHAYALAALAQQAQMAEQCGIAGMLKTTCPYCEQGFAFDCPTCSGHGLVGGHMPDGSGHGEPCPDCNAPQPAVPVVEAFAEGWRMAADWANRDDLLPDMDSPQYAKERDERLAELRPAVEPMTPEQWCEVLGTAGVDLLELAKMWSDNKIHVYQFTNEAEKIVKAAVLRGITAKAEDAHQPTKEAEK